VLSVLTVAAFVFVGCKDDNSTGLGSSGTIIINPLPDSISAPWTLTGPGDFTRSGSGVETLNELASGEYILEWGGLSKWITPASTHETLTAGTTLTFSGTYEFGLQPGPTDGVDVWITSVYDSRNDHRLRVGGWGDVYYTMIRFDLTDFPSSVTAATLYLYTWGNDSASNVSMDLHRVTDAWSEAVDWQSQPTTTNVRLVPTPVLGRWYELDITDLYNGWRAGNFPNYGLQLRPTSNNHEFNEFYSSDYSDDPYLRPKLVITP